MSDDDISRDDEREDGLADTLALDVSKAITDSMEAIGTEIGFLVIVGVDCEIAVQTNIEREDLVGILRRYLEDLERGQMGPPS